MKFGGFDAIRRTLGHRDYGLYSAGNAVSLVGNWVQRVAVGWLAWELTHSGAWLGLLAMAELSPALVLGPLGGAVADRGGRLRLIAIAQAVSMATSVVLVGLIVTDWVTPELLILV
ncbi:MAG: MFS transporter, partial [Alphaproteobacteria bacterium]